MRIAIDLQCSQTSSATRGIGRLSLAIAQELSALAVDDEVWILLGSLDADSLQRVIGLFQGLVPADRVIAISLPGPVAECVVANGWRVRVAELCRENFLRDLDVDVVLVTSLFEGWGDNAVTSIGRLHRDVLTAVIQHDLIPYMRQEAYLRDPAERAFYMRKIDSLRRADLLLAVSHHSKLEAIENLQFDPARIEVIGGAADGRFCPGPPARELDAATLDRRGIVRPFIFCAPGGFDSRKNVPMLIRAFASLPVGIRQQHQLAVSSEPLPSTREELMGLGRSLGLEEDGLVFLGYVQDELLTTLYRSCAAFVFPSEHEGFGLPALEAMSCGAPTLGARSTSLVEVIGWDEALFDPGSVEDLCAKLIQVLTSPPFRAALQEHGLVQSKLFSWRRTAELTLQGLRAAVARAATQRPRQADEGRARTGYQRLVSAIGELTTDVKPRPMDLIAVAAAIAQNEALSLRVRGKPVHDTSVHS